MYDFWGYCKQFLCYMYLFLLLAGLLISRWDDMKSWLSSILPPSFAILHCSLEVFIVLCRLFWKMLSTACWDLCLLFLAGLLTYIWTFVYFQPFCWQVTLLCSICCNSFWSYMFICSFALLLTDQLIRSSWMISAWLCKGGFGLFCWPFIVLTDCIWAPYTSTLHTRHCLLHYFDLFSQSFILCFDVYYCSQSFSYFPSGTHYMRGTERSTYRP